MSRIEGDLWARADALLDAALDLPAAERRPYVESAAEGEPELRRLALRLLEAADEVEAGGNTLIPAGGGRDSPLVDEYLRESGEDLLADEAGVLLGRYRIVREVGRGGMAVVYLGERADGEFQQQVAIKRIKRGFDTDEILRRFEQERQILALAEHPNVARLLDGGEDDSGRPYFVMEYVEGQPIDRYADREELSVRGRLKLFLQVARAVSSAHRNLVIHRDIKPSNILVDPEGHVRLLDFGIAKLFRQEEGEAGQLTRTDARVMTPVYASPEQVSGRPVTTASDVYQLGILLYQLLAGRWPYRTENRSPSAVAQAVSEQTPTRPSSAAVDPAGSPPPGESEPLPPSELAALRGTSPARLRRQLAGDLDTVVLRALAKEPERRYASVAQLIDDVEAYLDGRPVAARSDTFFYRAKKFIARNRAAALVALAAVLVLLGWGAIYTVQLTRERDRAQLAAAEAIQVANFLRQLFEVSAPTRSQGEQITARSLLDRGARRIESELAGQPDLQASLMTVMGDVYRELALYHESRDLLEGAVSRRSGDAPPLATAQTLFALARVLEEEGETADSEAAYQRALELRTEELGPDHPEVARVLNGLGRVRRMEGEFEEALAFHERALAVFEARAVGAEAARYEPEVARTLQHMGGLLVEVRRYEEARARLEQALALFLEHYEPDHPYVADLRVDLAEALRFTGEPQRAREEYELALPLLEKVYGSSHPKVADVLTRFAHLLIGMDETAETLECHLRALDIRREAFGASHHRVAGSLNNLGYTHWYMGNLEEAERYFRESAAMFEETMGAEHLETSRPLSNLAGVLYDQGRYEESVPLNERVLEIRRQVFGPDHSMLNPPLARLGGLWLRLGEPARAEPFLRQALAVGRNEDPHRVSEILLPSLQLGRCLTRLGRYEEAETYLLTALEGGSGLGRYQESRTHEALAELYGAWGKPEARARHEALHAELAAEVTAWKEE